MCTYICDLHTLRLQTTINRLTWGVIEGRDTSNNNRHQHSQSFIFLTLSNAVFWLRVAVYFAMNMQYFGLRSTRFVLEDWHRRLLEVPFAGKHLNKKENRKWNRGKDGYLFCLLLFLIIIKLWWNVPLNVLMGFHYSLISLW